MIKSLIINLIVSLGIGGLSAFFTRNSMDIYQYINLPPFAPPSILFPIAWTILYILMAISATLISKKDNDNSSNAIMLYRMQLIVNFIWPFLFFGAQAFLASFVCILILLFLIILMIYQFYKIDKTAAYLQIPYLIWTSFATILNFSIYILNR